MTYQTDMSMRLQGYPEGWYAVAFSEELKNGDVLRRRIMDQELVVFRTESGKAVVLDAFCPHLGAHLAEGGKVRGEHIECPFHGFRFADDGVCTSTPYGGRVPKAKTPCWKVDEQFGVVLVFYKQDTEFGDWAIKEVAEEHQQLQWSKPVGRLFRFRTHPQEIIENTVDIGHFSPVHGYLNVDIDEDMQCDGPHLNMKYIATRKNGLFGKLDPNKLKMHLDINASGVGFSRVQVSDLRMGLNLRFIVMPTPINQEEVEVRVIAQAAQPTQKLWKHIRRIIPGNLIAFVLSKVASAEMAKDFIPDKRIWENKIFQNKPKLAEGDGPIMPFRQWAQKLMGKTDNTAQSRISLEEVS